MKINECKMVILDTNALIAWEQHEHSENQIIVENLLKLQNNGYKFAIPTVVKMEFFRGLMGRAREKRERLKSVMSSLVDQLIVPTDNDLKRAQEFLEYLIIDRGFNMSQDRQRAQGFIIDMIVAATAHCRNLPLATANVKDFKLLESKGLKLLDLRGVRNEAGAGGHPGGESRGGDGGR